MKIVCNIKGPLLVHLARRDLIDAVLLTPSRYEFPELQKDSSLKRFPRYYETDFKTNSIHPKELAELHNSFSRKIDVRILPDILRNPMGSIVQYQEYLNYYNGAGRLLFPHQSTSLDEQVLLLVEEYNGIVGLPFRIFQGRLTRLVRVIESILERGLDYHLLGFHPSYWPPWLFTQAYSFDSQAILSYAKKYPSLFRLRRDGTWKEIDERTTGLVPLSLETRIEIYFEQLKKWLSLDFSSSQSSPPQFIEN